MTHSIAYSPEALGELKAILDYIAAQSSTRVAEAYVQRITTFCNALSTFPNRGTLRDDVRPGVRTIGFERRVTVAFEVSDQTVLILHVLYGGRDLDAAFT